MKVADLMQRNVKSIRSEASVAEAVLTLADGHISGLPVLDASGRMVGVLSSSDVLAAEAEAEDATSRQTLLESTQVQEIMTRRPYTIAPTAGVHEAAQQMLYADVHRLFVTQGDTVVGVISTTDIVRAVAKGQL
ncbi:MAG TPA: CBS domain-containing protein [Gemmatimonadales bacterium]|nr:CBS domain-containing protein [Gemmatimonadales bacterium]